MPRGRKRGGLPAPSAESAGRKTKRGRFLELAPKRTVKALAALENVGKCASSVSYEFNPTEAEKIIAALNEKLSSVALRFRNREPQVAESFTL